MEICTVHWDLEFQCPSVWLSHSSGTEIASSTALGLPPLVMGDGGGGADGEARGDLLVVVLASSVNSSTLALLAGVGTWSKGYGIE